MKPAPNDDSANVNLLWVGLLVEGALVGLALLIAQLNFYDHTQPVEQWVSLEWTRVAVAGLIATLPPLAYLVLFHFWRPRFYAPLREFVQQYLKPIFAESGWIELLVLSISAGLGEELFFRWALQGGFFSTLEPIVGYSVAILISIAIASLLFGICHWVNVTYFVFALLAGIYFGVVMVVTETWITAAIAHALFDLVALLYIQNLAGPSSELVD